MSKIIDLCLSLPESEEQIVRKMQTWAKGRGVKGGANYRYIFGPGQAAALGLTIDELEQMSAELSSKEFEDMIIERARPHLVSLEHFVEELDEAGVQWGVIESPSNDQTAEIVAKFPNKFVGIAIVNPHDGMRAVKELERAVKELGLKALLASPLSRYFRARV